MIVVSNTSPLTNLAAIGQFSLLESLFGKITITPAVMNELTAKGKKWPGAKEVEASDWIEINSVNNSLSVDVLRMDLDMGESETIILALELNASLVLLDEQAGRYTAQHFGLKPMGVVGLLVRAKKIGLLTQIRPLLDDLRQKAGFYLSQSIYHHALNLANE